jgi:hypothetical protein
MWRLRAEHANTEHEAIGPRHSADRDLHRSKRTTARTLQ